MSQNKDDKHHYMKETKSHSYRVEAIQRDLKNKSNSTINYSKNTQKAISQKKINIKEISLQQKGYYNKQSQKSQPQKQERQNHHKQQQQRDQQNHLKVTPKNYFSKDTKINQNNQQEKYKSQNQRVQNLNKNRYNLSNKTQIKQIDQGKQWLQKSLPLKLEYKNLKYQKNKSQICGKNSQAKKTTNFLLIKKKKQTQEQSLMTPVKQKQHIQRDSYAKQQTNKQPNNINNQNEKSTQKKQKQVYIQKYIQENRPIHQNKEEQNEMLIIEQSNQQSSNAKLQNKQLKAEQGNQQLNKIGLLNKSPLNAQKNKSPINAQSNKSPLNAQSNKSPLNSQSNKSPLNAQSNKQPMNSQSNKSPLDAQKNKSPLNAQSKKSPLNSQSPFNAQSNKQPINAYTNTQPKNKDEADQQKIKVEQRNLQPITNEQSTQQPIQAEQQDDQFLDIEQINKQALNTEKQNMQSLNVELNKSLQAIKIVFDQKRLEKSVEICKLLIQMSSGQRTVEQNYSYYLQQYEDIQGLFSHYSIKHLEVKTNLKKYCQKILYVRGDGNCFYTAFGYQFLRLVLISYNDTQFNEFLNFAIQIKFKIYYKDFKIADDKIEQLLNEEFLYKLQEIRNIENQQDRIDLLYKIYREFDISDDGNGCFYFLSTLFFRNLSNQLQEHSEMKAYVEDRENLLKWETECNNNEIVVATLAQQLKINIKLLFFNEGQFVFREYEQHEKDEMILLIQPGHYNIGLKN
ncbi:unnamed protein product (macronuclear) [Paramecium tetraurelia]|uniref:ubiquitinyl hydrolase 1 n=1 Tax=Paramecium tetraurelia TaxID=5888 RepID=A0D2Y9_PARTE|nr:uncharacterized protein GSPATT00012891001 [Paramecium tetraurelia]CAK77406.1 unnamed protein product [Paramecium tetraurelia]|eukprot:XP_001444803.1 hypothetical protein (macronuclear) [Paramecium tetraurelia strain d4-2]